MQSGGTNFSSKMQEDDHFPIPFPASPQDRRTYEIHDHDPAGMGRAGSEVAVGRKREMPTPVAEK